MELKIKKLSKQFKDKTAVDDVSLTLTPGIWGLLGANGAGKTTLMRMLAGILKPARGEIFYNGKDIHTMGEAYRDRLGYLPQEFGFFHDFTVKDYLEYVAALKDIPREETGDRIDHLLHTLTLREVKNKKIIKLSGGMKRRVGIAQAMLNDPEILIMDEPTAGLDPGERVRFRNLISEFSQERIVLISTHIVSDIEYIATQNAIMKSGKILAAGKTEQLVQLADGEVWSCLVPAEKMPLYEMQLRIINRRSEGNNRVAIRYLSEEKKISDSVTVPPSLEDLYLWLFPEENINEGGR
ncbi:ABC-type multidrug transport system ATPase subunit [Lacrimispora xylanisolvens]|uniref:ABC-type multidrug transport system ATPase subunit n=1 Tax=Lacrimispora xylanisolvens TaxID=384636 RepID=A0A2S6HBA2_9FIRM|nr:ABC transporter ATP-binding protein [Hungatella xylanolytica]PPK74757.1 ABC-type multidrug transport system ATPase subunit [Hungatella xylanolytica]